MKFRSMSYILPLTSISLMLLLCACNHGNHKAPTAPALSLTPQSIKTFHFTWADTTNETEYRLLEDPDSVSGYTQIATISANVLSYDLIVSLPKRINARYILESCNADGCTDSTPVNVSGTLAEAIGYVKASNPGLEDEFGYRVSLAADGNTLAIGAFQEWSSATGIDGDQSDNSGEYSGAVYVFSHNGTNWVQQAYIKASNTDIFDYFGARVALSYDGNTLAVSAYNEGSSATGINGDQNDNSALASGAVYVFTRIGSNWSQQAYIKASNTGEADWFGFSIAIAGDGTTLAVGAVYESSGATGIDGDQSDNSIEASGAVYVFIRNGSSWSQQAYVKASNTARFDWFGNAVALDADGDTLAIGAISKVDNMGAAYIFTRSGANWSQQAYLIASNGDFTDNFGISTALSANGNTLAVGSVLEDSNATGIDGDQSDNSTESSGAVYIFTRSSDETWNQEAYIKASNTEGDDFFGYSVALTADGNMMAVGATHEDSNATGVGNNDQTNNSTSESGAVYVFTRSNTNWRQQAYVKASNTGERDWFGWSVALDADGNTLAVGAIEESSSAVGIDGDQSDNSVGLSGAVYLY